MEDGIFPIQYLLSHRERSWGATAIGNGHRRARLVSVQDLLFLSLRVRDSRHRSYC